VCPPRVATLPELGSIISACKEGLGLDPTVVTGISVVGSVEVVTVGTALGEMLGASEISTVGITLGAALGEVLGASEISTVGITLGAALGEVLGLWCIGDQYSRHYTGYGTR
jgi:hypothetical protein